MPVKKLTTQYTDEEIATMVALYKGGMSMRKIGKEVHSSYTTVRRILGRQEGVVIRRPGRYPNQGV